MTKEIGRVRWARSPGVALAVSLLLCAGLGRPAWADGGVSAAPAVPSDEALGLAPATDPSSADGATLGSQGADVRGSFLGSYGRDAAAQWASQRNANDGLVAADGQTLADQPKSVQDQFTAQFGPAAAADWAAEHDAELGVDNSKAKAAIANLNPLIPSETALSDIPQEYLALYVDAGQRYGVPWQVLAGIGRVESNHGRDPSAYRPNYAGAVGPMQFLPSTFQAYSGASASGSPSVLEPRDSIYAAAAMLANDGASVNLRGAIFDYNHDNSYVNLVLYWAKQYGMRQG